MIKYLSELEIGETGKIAGFDTSRVDDQEFAAQLGTEISLIQSKHAKNYF